MTRLLAAAIGCAVFSIFAAVPALPDEPKAKPTAPAAAEMLAVTVEADVHYDTIEKEKLYLDIAVPKGEGPFPCVVMFHGGAWTAGSRKDLSAGDRNGGAAPSLIETVAARGYVAVSVGYRLAPKHPFPAQIQDARAAVRFLRANAKKYKLDPDKFGAVGFSAGGHLALLLGMAEKAEGWDAGENASQNPGVSPAVQCVVDFYGPTDLTLYAKTPALEDSFMVPVFGKAVKTDPEVYKKASPITYVSKDAPPVLILHGTVDLIVPFLHSENLRKELKEAGAKVELVRVRGAGHGWNGSNFARTTEDMIRFLDTHLKGKAK